MRLNSKINYHIINENSGKSLDVAGWNIENGATIHQWSLHGGDNQKWNFIDDGEGFYEIIARHSGLCLDDAQNSTEDGGIIHQYTRHFGDNQKWKLENSDDGCTFIISKIGRLCLDATREIEDGTSIILWSKHGGINQKWRIIPAIGEEIAESMFFIDGSNICQWEKPVNLSVLLTLLIELRKQGKEFLCIFDANTRYILSRQGLKNDRNVYEQLLREFSKLIIEVPGRTRADDFLLKRADTSKSNIISNDQFRNYHSRYKWLHSEPHRLFRGTVVGNYLTIPELEIDTQIQRNSKVLKQNLYAMFE
jgi:Ricin-type beta-trefoil lectin domain-like/Zc3h12a-like Ribonuclease NYN domain